MPGPFEVQYTWENPAPNPEPTAQSGPDLLVGANWLDANWMFIATALCPISLILIFVAFNIPMAQKLKHPLVLGWSALFWYFAHQFEEHAYDARGWHYAFVPGFNWFEGYTLFPPCKIRNHLQCPADPTMATMINIPAIWVGYTITLIVAHCKGGYYIYAPIINWGMSVVNAFGGHIVPILFIGYNAGAIQSVFMLLFGGWVITREGPRFARVCIINGVLFHALSFGVGMNVVFILDPPDQFKYVIIGSLCCFMTTVFPMALASRYAPQKPLWFTMEKKAFAQEKDETLLSNC